jgi:serine/threonine-protein phosphatase PP1 catalytic subunit
VQRILGAGADDEPGAEGDGDSKPLALFQPVRTSRRPPPFSTERVRNVKWISDVANWFLHGGTLQHNELQAVVAAALTVLQSEPAMVEVSVPAGGHLVVLGDTHGQYDDLHTLLQAGIIGEDRALVINGDLVDRGPKQIQVITMALLLKLAFPRRIFIVRGNHETRAMNEMTAKGFKNIVTRKYGVQMWHRLSEAFDELPIAALVEGTILCVHGGLPTKASESLEIEEIRTLTKGDLSGWAYELMWNDSSPAKGIRENQRGPGTYTFGADVTKKFLEQNSLRPLDADF